MPAWRYQVNESSPRRNKPKPDAVEDMLNFILNEPEFDGLTLGGEANLLSL
jgi:hypothetical protein